MQEFENNAYFWQKVDTLVASCNQKISWYKGDNHPDIKGSVFPLDSGLLILDDSEIGQFYKGSHGNKVDGLIIICDILDKQIRSVFLIGCDASEQEETLRFIDANDFKKCIIVRRGYDVPSWGAEKNDED